MNPLTKIPARVNISLVLHIRPTNSVFADAINNYPEYIQKPSCKDR
jgi:hypothetical protein